VDFYEIRKVKGMKDDEGRMFVGKFYRIGYKNVDGN